MVKHYFGHLEFIDAEDDDILELQPASTANKRLRILYQECATLNQKLRANIVHNPGFESGCARVLRGKMDRLTRAEQAVAVCSCHTGQRTIEHCGGGGFVEHLRKRRRLGEETVKYGQLKRFPSMPNVVECIFSVACVAAVWSSAAHSRDGSLPA
ncbi:hypothetical protein GQ600_20486 [Phytophthora cactorum]|nr:hypothetical protein GQ600_20486 [Phytophthora cactorum]